MNTCYTRSALLPALCLLSALAAAQWTAPIPWDYAGFADKGRAVAVDRRGNVYVAGTVTQISGLREYGVRSYDSSGTYRWQNFWHDSASDTDDVATAIAVDFEGNCYVSGVSHIATGMGITTTKFAVVKMDMATGAKLWPTSGTHTGYNFDLGAIVLSDSDYDGFDTFAQWRCALSMEEVPGSQPTFAITGPTTQGSGFLWKTAVFESDPTDGIRLKAGWPIDDFGGSNDDESMDVKISPIDNTVYVTGGATNPGDGHLQFCTVRYRADGSAKIWTDWFVDGSYRGKPSEGRSIAIDRDGNAYVTGVIMKALGDNEYATRKIERNPSSGIPPLVVDDWSSFYNPTSGDDEATSINLSFEYTCGIIVPYAYVTGLSYNSGSFDIASIRYETTAGTDQWSPADHYSAGLSTTSDPEQWPRILAGGLGNAYVIGTRYTSNDDYVLLALNRTDSTRFGPTYFDRSYDDEGSFCATGGAGLLYYTGQSESGAGISTYDYESIRHIETASSFVPSSLTIDSGTHTGGLVSDVASDNSVYYEVQNSAGTGSSASVEFFGNVGSTSSTELSVTLKGKTDGAGAREKVEVFSQITSSYQLVSDQPAPSTDTYTVIPLKDDPAEYVDGSGNVAVRVTYYGSTSLSWKGYFDLVRWDVIG